VPQGHAEPERALRGTLLRIAFDGASEPQVAAPAGDFFGSGPGVNPFDSLPMAVLRDGTMVCRFPMPFRQGFRLEVENRDRSIGTDVYANVLYQEQECLPDNAAYFHARFATGASDGAAPIVIACTEGHGHYAGCTLSMQCRSRNCLAFLEAPEHVYIDADWDAPRFTGTGLEDYFQGGWYFREGEFTGPLHGVPSRDPFDSSVAMYRVHERDAIRFTNRFRLEFTHPWGQDTDRPVAWSSCSFYYLDTPNGTGTALPNRDKLLCWYRMHERDHWSAT